MALDRAVLVAGAALAGLVMLSRSQPRGIRNHNPGNIRQANQDWRGEVGDDGDFVIFSAPEWGIRAMARILKTYRRRGVVTLRGILATWAPPTENNTAAYVDHLAGRLGVDPDAVLDPARDPELIAGIIHHENGIQPYAFDVIEKGVSWA